jgi:chromosome partitioning protein
VKIICFFGLKGGVGKTSLAAAVATAAQEAGFSTAVLDLDGSGTGLDAFVTRRRNAGLVAPQSITTPTRSFLSAANSRRATEEMDGAIDQARLRGADCLVVDSSSGRDALWMNAAAILACHVLVTPLTDSPLDLQMLLGKGAAQSVADFVEAAAGYRGRQNFKWIVVRNRRGHLDTKLSGRITAELAEAAQRFGFEVVEGLRERVGYREMFEDGRSPLDPPRTNAPIGMSVLSARTEMRMLLSSLELHKPITPAWLTAGASSAEVVETDAA